MPAQSIWHNEYVKPVIAIVIVVCVLSGVFFGLQLTARVVESGSMCIPYDGYCDGLLSLDHTFNGTLHKGDIIIVQHVNPEDLNTNYPNSDIIVYKDPRDPTGTPIVHRIVTSYTENGVLHFQTKGDGNGYNRWPQTPSSDEYDSDSIWFTGQGIAADQVEGKVVLRIPYFGWLTLILQGNHWIVAALVGVIVVLLVLEFVMPEIRKRKVTSTPI